MREYCDPEDGSSKYFELSLKNEKLNFKERSSMRQVRQGGQQNIIKSKTVMNEI